MKKLISPKLAGKILLVLFGLLVIFHILVITNLFPTNVVWGGQAGGSPSNLRALETVSLLLTVLFAMVVAARIGYIKAGKLGKVINILLWIIFAYLLLNTAGNLASNSSLEKLLFTPITILAAFLVLRLAVEK
jgi:hypothetical protein